MIGRTLTLLARLLVGGVFVWAGTAKLLEPEPLVSALDWVGPALGLAPSGLLVIRDVLPRVEIVVGLGLLSGLYLRPALVTAGAMLLVFLGVLVAGTFQRGGIEACGCFGQHVLDSGGPAVWIARNAVLAALSLAGAVCGSAAFSLDRLLAGRRPGAEPPGMLAGRGGGA